MTPPTSKYSAYTSPPDASTMSPANRATLRLVFRMNSRVAVTAGLESSTRSTRIVQMNDGAPTEVIESAPMADADERRDRRADGSGQAGTESTGPERRKGVRAR